MHTTRPNHTHPLWKRVFVQALHGLIVAGGAAARDQESGDTHPPPPENTFQATGETGIATVDESAVDLGPYHHAPAPVPEFADEQDADLTFHDLLAEEAALVADAAVRLVRRREEESASPGRANVIRENHGGGRRPVGNIGKVPVYGRQPK